MKPETSIERIRTAEALNELKQFVSADAIEKHNRQYESPVYWHVAIRERYIGTVNC